jgi:hypothetical protein
MNTTDTDGWLDYYKASAVMRQHKKPRTYIHLWSTIQIFDLIDVVRTTVMFGSGAYDHSR